MRKYWVLFDFDDTLGGVVIDGRVVPTHRAYAVIRERFCTRMAELGYSRELAAKILDRVDKQAAASVGFGDKARFPRSLVTTYSILAIGMGHDPDPEIEREIEDLGYRVFTDFPYAPLPGALALLEAVSRGWKVAVVTKGDVSEQVKKLIDSSVIQYLDYYRVLSHKTCEEWEEVLDCLEIWPPVRRFTWAIGNSVKADVNPPLQLGLNAIHLVDEESWDFEKDEYATPRAGRRLHRVHSIGDVLKYLPLTQ